MNPFGGTTPRLWDTNLGPSSRFRYSEALLFIY